MSKIPKKGREKLHSFGDHNKFLNRIRKTLYYGKLPTTDRLSWPVTELATELFSKARNCRSIERLHSNDAAAISRNACVSPCSLVLAMLYLDRLKACNPEYLQRVAPSELFLVSLMVSCKFLYDDGEQDEVFMDEWAKSGGITTKQLIDLEKDFLNAIQWEVYINQSSFWNKLKSLETEVAKREGFSRGWFTYTELESLMAIDDIQYLLRCVVSITAVLMAAYTAGIMTILGSMFIVSHMPGNCLQKQPVQANQTTLNTFLDISIDGNIILKESNVMLESLKNINFQTGINHNGRVMNPGEYITNNIDELDISNNHGFEINYAVESVINYPDDSVISYTEDSVINYTDSGMTQAHNYGTQPTDYNAIKHSNDYGNYNHGLEPQAYTKPMDAINVLKTGIILASIKSVPVTKAECNRSCYDFNDERSESISWDWWTSPTMTWLSQTSKIIEKFDFIPLNYNYDYDRYMEMCIANCKKLDLEDQLHEGTTVRIQEQMERSWHKEWTDTILSKEFHEKYTVPDFLHNFKM